MIFAGVGIALPGFIFKYKTIAGAFSTKKCLALYYAGSRRP
jgi:hypothetical protein